MRKITYLLALFVCVSSLTAQTVVSELSNKTIASIGENATSLVEGQWYVLHNHGRNVCVSEETSTMKMRNLPALYVEPSVTAGQLFKLTSAGVDGQYYIMSGNGLYFDFTENNTSTISNSPVAYKVATIGENVGHFYIQHAGNSYVADGQRNGESFVCWEKTVPTGTGGNNCYHFKPVNLAEISRVNVTYNYYLNGVLKHTEVVENQIAGSSYNAPTIDCVSLSYENDNTISSENKEIRVNCTEDLPFIASADYETAKWYVVDMHCNDSGTPLILNGTNRYVWTYDADGAENKDIVLPQEPSKQTAVFGDEKLWCFVGNVFDGFKIYNKAAGNSLTLNKPADNNTPASMSDATSATMYALASSTQVNGAICFLPKGHSYYLNTQATDGIKYMRGWNQKDGGSSCRFFAPTDFVKPSLEQWLMPVGAVGAPVTMTEEMGAALQNAYSAIVNDAWNTTAITTQVTQILDALAQDEERVVFAPGYYFVKGTGDEHGDPAYTSYNEPWYLTHYVEEGENYMKAVVLEEGKKPTADHIWQFEAIEGESGYKLQQVNLKAYASLVAAGSGTSTVTADKNNGNKFLLTDTGVGKFIIKNGANAVMRTEGDGRVNTWGTESEETWYLIPATELDINMVAAQGGAYTSIYLPFAVTLDEGTKAYAGEVSDTKDVLNMTKLGNVVPAETPVVLVSDNAGAHTLTIGGTAEAVENNDLEGTLTPIVFTDNKADYLIFGIASEKAGFYKSAGDKISANKAYLPASLVATAQTVKMNFGGEATGIEAIEKADNAKAPIYDLSGRRVVNTAKGGIYIQNGRKFIVK